MFGTQWFLAPFGMFMPESLCNWTQKIENSQPLSFPSRFPLLLPSSFPPPFSPHPSSSSFPPLLSGCTWHHYHHCCGSFGARCAHLCILLLLLHLVFEEEEDVRLCTYHKMALWYNVCYVSVNQLCLHQDQQLSSLLTKFVRNFGMYVPVKLNWLEV